MEQSKVIPPPQPTESEAIVAAQRAPQTPETPLVPPVPLPVDKAAAIKPGSSGAKGHLGTLVASALAGEDSKPLGRKTLHFSKEMVVVAAVFQAVGLGLIFSPWHLGLLIGLVCSGVSFGVFFTAGTYWGCDNESCT